MILKVLIISDIHGNVDILKKILDENDFDKLIVLGDLFNYGFFSNDLKNNKIINLLQKNKDKLILIRGNCDYYINYEDVGLFAHDLITIPLNGHNVTLTHGNRYSKGFLPDYHGDIFMQGHTHVSLLTKENNIVYLNPGSISKPRGGSSASYATFNDDVITLKTIDHKTIKEMKV